MTFETSLLSVTMMSNTTSGGGGVGVGGGTVIVTPPPPLLLLSRGGHTAVSVCLGSIMVLGFLNNLLVLVLFCRFRALRTPVNVLLLNISVSDLLVCVCGTTLSFASSLRAHWLYGRHGCMWYGFVNSCFGSTLRNR
ncbi:hypothetical protein CRUP_013553 [Coryphaenoides rupestris]|nr:hypothetical protein CRUP_013553 [Coryphaenoides rupestris]